MISHQEFNDLFHHKNFEISRRFGSSHKYSTEPIKKALDRIKNPQYHFKTIHVAGTVAKGSVTHILGQMLLAQKIQRVGFFFSPHLNKINERIQINDSMISDIQLTEITDEIMEKIEISKLSFFDLITLIAFYYFYKQEVNWAVIETGLGGRKDSTNNLKPEFCVISPIGYDHTDTLGNTLEKIAYEKAGIIRECPVYSFPQKKEVLSVLRKEAKKKKSPLFVYSPENDFESMDYPRQNLEVCKWIYQHFFMQKPMKVKYELKGRLEKWRDSPLLYFDSAHNQMAAGSLVSWLKIFQLKNRSEKKWIIYMNCLRSKNLLEFIQPFLELTHTHINEIFLIPMQGHIRFYTYKDIERNSKLKENISQLKDIKDMKKWIHDPDYFHLICGSMYLYSIKEASLNIITP